MNLISLPIHLPQKFRVDAGVTSNAEDPIKLPSVPTTMLEAKHNVGDQIRLIEVDRVIALCRDYVRPVFETCKKRFVAIPPILFSLRGRPGSREIVCHA